MLLVEEVAEGTVIVREGDHGDRIYFISHGSVEVRKHRVTAEGSVGQEVVLARLGVGQAFGEMELVDLQPRSSTVAALEPCTLLTLSMRDLLHLHQGHPQILTILVMNLARDLSRRLRKADERIAGGV